MKIDTAEAPKIRDLLDKLLLDQHNLHCVNESSADQFRVVSEGGTHAGELTKAELLAAFQARIDAGTKHLAQRYQIDFTKANVNAPSMPAGAQPQPPSPDEVAS